MLDRRLRGIKDRTLGPLARAMGSAVHPNAITGAGLALGLLSAGAAMAGHLGWALLAWIGNRFLDGLDGPLARAQGRATDLGGYLDLMADFVVYAAIPVGLAMARPDAGVLLALAVMLGAFYVNAASWMVLTPFLERRIRAGLAGGERTSLAMPGGLVEGTETALLFTAFFLLPGHLAELFWLTAFLVSITALQRLWWAARNL